jgi:hypothetical protein
MHMALGKLTDKVTVYDTLLQHDARWVLGIVVL